MRTFDAEMNEIAGLVGKAARAEASEQDFERMWGLVTVLHEEIRDLQRSRDELLAQVVEAHDVIPDVIPHVSDGAGRSKLADRIRRMKENHEHIMSNMRGCIAELRRERGLK